MKLKGKRILITGGSGFIGMRAAKAWRAAGAKVSGLDIKKPKSHADFEEFFVGDITDDKICNAALKGADIILHTAAVVKESGDWEFFRKVNVDGTRRLAHLASEAGASLFIHLSSVMVYGFTFPEEVSEEGPYRGENNPYCQTKIESEDAVTDQCEVDKLNYIIIRPGDVYGPDSVPWVVRPLQLMKKMMFVLPGDGEGIINHVHVDNLIDGISLAIDKDKFGEAYNITDGQRTTCKDYFTRLAASAGLGAPLTLPAWLLSPVFQLLYFIQNTGLDLGAPHPDALFYLQRPAAYSIEKAKSELGYEPKIKLDVGMAQLQEWVSEHKEVIA